MEVDVQLESIVIELNGPPASVHGVAFVSADPTELDSGLAVDRGRPTVHPPLDGDESKRARAVRQKLDVRRSHEVEGVTIPQIRLLDSPLAPDLTIRI